MYSFYCEDLQQTIDVSTETNQPFWYADNEFNPMEEAAPLDFLGRYYNDIVSAHNNHLTWQTNTIKLGYSLESGDDRTALIKATYTSNNDKIRIYVGYVLGIPTTAPDSPSNWSHNTYSEFSFTDYSNNHKLGNIYFYQRKMRDLYDTPPAYTGVEAFCMRFYSVDIFSGTPKPPAPPSYPYGWWEYNYRRLGNIEELPICTPCQANGETVTDCEVIVGRQGNYDKISRLNSFYMSDADGNYNPDPDEPVPEDPFDPSLPDPYLPDKDDSSDEIDIPPVPPIGVSNAGFINVYNPGMNALQNLGDIIFPNPATATDVVDAIMKLCETFANANLINYVIDCHVIPVKPTVGTSKAIKVGFNYTSIMVPVVTSDYIDVSCGALNIREYFGGFQDYTLTRSKLFLPFVGFVETLPEYWVAGTIKVDYRFNVIDGSFMCFIRSTSSRSQLSDSVIAQYSGNACMHFPITGVNYATMVSGLVGAVTSMGSSKTATGALGGAYSAANTVAQWGDVQQSNGYNATSCLLGVRTPYLLIERPVPSYAGNYKHDRGMPSNISMILSNVSGYTEISDIDLSGIPLTQAELDELRGLLRDGVYF